MAKIIVSDFSPAKSEEIRVEIASDLHAGFPVPASDEPMARIDLSKEIINHPESTFYARIAGDSMREIGIFDGDIVVVDRSRSPHDGSIIVAYLDGEFTIKEYRRDSAGQCAWLIPHNKDYEPIKVTQENDFVIWGVVTHNVHKLV